MFLIDPHSPQPIYEQIIVAIKEKVLTGKLCPGDQLPPVRQLATLLAINPNTVSRAYQELERQKVISTTRSKGTFICELSLQQKNVEEIQAIYKDMKNLCVKLHYIGITREELFHQLNLMLDDLQKGSRHDQDPSTF